jgi:hypothetical protein
LLCARFGRGSRRSQHVESLHHQVEGELGLRGVHAFGFAPEQVALELLQLQARDLVELAQIVALSDGLLTLHCESRNLLLKGCDPVCQRRVHDGRHIHPTSSAPA